MRAAARGPLRVMFPMVTDVEDWDAAMEHGGALPPEPAGAGRARLTKIPQFGVMLSMPSPPA